MRHDSARLAALRQLMILDSTPEQAYDDITRLLQSRLGVPIVMVNLLDEKRDWFKSRVGIDLQESPAATSFCEIFFKTDDDLVVVEDTATDARFAAHPLVQGQPHVRFYAAARLKLGAQTVGTLCAYDLQPRQLQPAEVDELRTLATAALNLLQRRALGDPLKTADAPQR